MTKKVAIQGAQASFHAIAAHQFFGDDIELINRDTFKETFAAVKAAQAQYAVCAIENSLFGSINATYDLLINYHFVITGEIYLRIEQCLIGLPGTKLSDITEVYSHPVALAQCEDYLDAKLPTANRLEFHDTASSVLMVKQGARKQAAAIAGREAAELHGMEILAESIETNKQNYTRFIVLEPQAGSAKGATKTSLIIRTSHQPGALYSALGVFAERGINLTKLQSRPIIGKAWHYIFYVDVDAGLQDSRLEEALKLLSQQGCEVKMLGSYQAGART